MIKCLVAGLKKDPLNVTSQYQQFVVQQAALTAEKDLNKTIPQVNMAGVFSSTTKQMLKNVIRHTNSHNKVSEALFDFPSSIFPMLSCLYGYLLGLKSEAFEPCDLAGCAAVKTCGFFHLQFSMQAASFSQSYP